MDGREAALAEFGRVLETRGRRAFSTADVRESIVHLMALRRFEDVRVDAEEARQGVRLTYDCAAAGVKGSSSAATSRCPLASCASEVTDRYGSSPSATRAREMARVAGGLLTATAGS